MVKYYQSSTNINNPQMIQKLMDQSRAIVYILEPVETKGNHVNFANEFHQRYLEMHIKISKDLNVHWNNIPWIFALNKTDLAQGIPPEADIVPIELISGMTRCIASEDIGIDELWTKITKAVNI